MNLEDAMVELLAALEREEEKFLKMMASLTPEQQEAAAWEAAAMFADRVVYESPDLATAAFRIRCAAENQLRDWIKDPSPIEGFHASALLAEAQAAEARVSLGW